MPVVEISNITKRFRIYSDKSSTLKERLLFHKRSKHSKNTVLEDISFCVEKGEALGLIGENGSGKSTLLKLISRIMYPDSGKIKVTGRVSSLLELGAGFHPDMSGRENIFINASIFGLSRREIKQRLDTIISFSELSEFIDSPVRTYSSGMYMRLAFAVAINVDADVLLIDEILAVGDTNFQAKCFDKLHQIKQSGTTIIIVSHDMKQLLEICDKCVWINKSKLVAIGSALEVSDQYTKYMAQKRQDQQEGGGT